MSAVLIHIDDDPGDLRFTGSRWSKMGGVHAQQIRVYNDQDASREDVARTVLSAIQAAIREGHHILICSDYSIGGAYGTSDCLWKVVWDRLSDHERTRVTDFAIRCTTEGIELLRRAMEELPNFKARVHLLPKESVDVIALGRFFSSFVAQFD